MCALTSLGSKLWFGLVAGILGPLLPLAADSLAERLPRKPRPVAALEVEERRDSAAEVWYRREQFLVAEDGRRVPHGVQIEHRRLRDRERHDREYTATHRCWYDGAPGPHQVVLTYAEGRLERIQYQVGEKAAITRHFDAFGREKPDPQGTRGAKHKRQNVLLLFDDVYGRLPPSP
jgi:hypothetical protein